MKHTVLASIQNELSRLDELERLWLLEQIVRRLRLNLRRKQLESELPEMASDPDIQREIELIEEEFSVALMDGLSEDSNGDKSG